MFDTHIATLLDTACLWEDTLEDLLASHLRAHCGLSADDRLDTSALPYPATLLYSTQL